MNMVKSRRASANTGQKGIEIKKRVDIGKQTARLSRWTPTSSSGSPSPTRIKADRDNAVMAAMKGYGSAPETKVVNAAAAPLSIPESEYKGLWQAVQKRLPSYSIDFDNVTTKAPFGEGNFQSRSASAHPDAAEHAVAALRAGSSSRPLHPAVGTYGAGRGVDYARRKTPTRPRSCPQR
jgi:hypothetical protein